MRRVVLVAFPGVQTLDVTGPAEVFRAASVIHPPGYKVTVAATQVGPLATSTVSFVADARLDQCNGRIDTLVVAGGTGARRVEGDPWLVEWIAEAAERSRRVASVCTGAFLLAKAGLLDGRRATTHWAGCADLASRYPAVTVEPDPIFVRDGNVATSAGVTAGMDLALALVEEDLGRDVALRPPAISSSSCSAPAARRSSAPSWPPRPPTGRRCASSRRGSRTTSTRTSPSRHSRAAPA